MMSPRAWRAAIAVLVCALSYESRGAFALHSDGVADSAIVDSEDFSRFQLCFGYPVTAQSCVDCARFDFDGNGAVDLTDLAARPFVLHARTFVFPPRALITYSQTMDFDAVVSGSGNQSVQWAVLPAPGSQPGESLGTIDANGLYSPPSMLDPHAASEVLVRATGAGPGPASDYACVALFSALAAHPPTSLVLPGSGGSSGIPSNVTTALPLVSLVLPGAGNLDALTMNVTLATPPVALVLPGAGDLDSPMNVTLAMPPVTLVLPGAGELDLAMNVTLASPPLALVLPGISEPDVFPPNTTVAYPPVTVDFANPP